MNTAPTAMSVVQGCDVGAARPSDAPFFFYIFYNFFRINCMKIELTAVDVVNNDELKCWTVTGDGRGGVMDGDSDGRCLKWPKGPNGDPQLAGVWEPTSSPSSKKGRIGYSTLP
ncbi:hypothetical protein C8F01DRAFT_1084157 [Mycena amicta]|nr:hypothetical protein C8F01DRAFT_1084157 [Mycena amicta]